VVIWKVVLPKGTLVNGTLVGDTRPTVRYGAKILDAPSARCGRRATPLLSFWRLTILPSASIAVIE
jgi:hypothetical protein